MGSGQQKAISHKITRKRLSVWVVGLLVVLLAMHCASTGIWSIQENEQGIVTRFGAQCRTVYPGLVFTLPWPIENLLVVNTKETQMMPVGFQLNKSFSTNEKEWLTGDMNIVDLEMMIHYTISNPSNYLFRVGPTYAEALIRKCAESVLTETIAIMSVDAILTTEKYQIEKQAQAKTQDLLDRYGAGMRISRANLKSIAPPRIVINAFKDVSSAKADREKAVQEADAYRRNLIPEARTQADQTLKRASMYADRVVSEAWGRTKRFESILSEYRQAKEITRSRLFLEVMGKTLDRPRKVIISPDSTGTYRVKMIQ